MDSISPDAAASQVASDALRECWAWLRGAAVTADSLGEYIDGPKEKELTRHMLDHQDGPVLKGLVAITEGVSYAAYHVYEAEKNRFRTESLWEVSEETLVGVLRDTEKLRGDLQLHVSRIVDRLAELSRGQSCSELGPELHRAQIFQMSSPASS